MKRVILILMALLPATVVAQQNDSRMPVDHAVAEGSQPTISTTAADERGFTTEALASAAAPEELQPEMSDQGPAPAASSYEIERPKIEGSMVGYIDEAIIGSQIRLRFEAGFGDDFPDLAEFFYAKCGCYTQSAISENAAYDPKAPGPGPGVVTNLNFQQLYVYGEYAFTGRFSIFTEIPVRWIQPTAFVQGFGTVPDAGGLGDIRGGFKLAAVDTDNSTLTIQIQGYFPSGKASAGLGTHHNSIEPAVLYYQRFSPKWALEAQAGDWHPIGGAAGVPPASAENSTGGPSTSTGGFAGDVFFYGIGPSYKIYDGESIGVAPVIEMVSWRVLSGFKTVWTTGSDIANTEDGTNIVNIKFGVRVTVGKHSSIYGGYGRAVTGSDWYRQIARIEYRYSF